MIGVDVLLGTFPKGAPIIFEYVTNGQDANGKFTGSNLAGTYDFDSFPDLKAAVINKQAMLVSAETNTQGDHRWAVSARVNASEVEFGFEDVSGGDYDYNDIVFIVSGVALDSEVKLGAPVVPKDTTFQGTYTVTLPPPPEINGTVVKLFYTTDGLDPSFDAAGNPTLTTKVYTAPFLITQTTTVKVQAWGPDVIDPVEGSRKVVPSVISVVTFTKEVFVLTTASGIYLDQNGDGRIDAVSLTFSVKPAQLPLKLVLEDPFAAGKKIELAAEALAKAIWAGAVLTVQFAEKPLTAGTGFPDKALGSFPTGPVLFDPAPFLIKDGVGPIANAAETAPPATGASSRLRVTFSEGVTVDTVSKIFPFQVKRNGAIVPNTNVVLQSVVSAGGNVYEFVFSPQSPVFPVAGDSLQLIATPALTDTKGTQSNMGIFIPVGGKAREVVFEIKAGGGGVVVADRLPNPRAIDIPVTVVLPRPDKDDKTSIICLDCLTGEWKAADPSRPVTFPRSPEIQISTESSFRFNIAFYNNVGEFVNRAKGEVTEAMLKDIPDSAGVKKVNLMWYPVTAKGDQAATGAYIARGTVTTTGLTGKTKGAQGEQLNIVNSMQNVNFTFGYVRR
ncbi:MAG: chitobiase/beta-hexosaminidase C-terminal domain-containing protein, partial [Fibrobacterota bacterium]|nr:chitobiase/beta-hexosaminidase C-terminal domain-containing protein [Fibrobacterota bacterium]